MSKNQILFYATAADLVGLLTTLEKDRHLQYTHSDLFLDRHPQTYRFCSAIPDFGCAVHPTAIANPTFLISTEGQKIHVREVPQKSGGIRFAIDQLINPDTISLSPGGRFGNDVILYGRIDTVSESPTSKDLFRFVGRALKKAFVRRQEYLVGPEALEAWKAGTRLTIGVASPREFDLQ